MSILAAALWTNSANFAEGRGGTVGRLLLEAFEQILTIFEQDLERLLKEEDLQETLRLVALNRATWLVGQRVSRKDTEEQGTIVEKTGDSIKVKWDGGRTSYFRHGEIGNVRLIRRESRAASVGRLTSATLFGILRQASGAWIFSARRAAKSCGPDRCFSMSS